MSAEPEQSGQLDPELHPPHHLDPAPAPPPASPLSVRLRKDSLCLRCRLKPPSSSALPGEPGIMLVWNQQEGGIRALLHHPPARLKLQPPLLMEMMRRGALPRGKAPRRVVSSAP